MNRHTLLNLAGHYCQNSTSFCGFCPPKPSTFYKHTSQVLQQNFNCVMSLTIADMLIERAGNMSKNFNCKSYHSFEHLTLNLIHTYMCVHLCSHIWKEESACLNYIWTSISTVKGRSRTLEPGLYRNFSAKALLNSNKTKSVYFVLRTNYPSLSFREILQKKFFYTYVKKKLPEETADTV